MNLGKESEWTEFKKSTAERKEAMDDVASILNKHKAGTLYFGVAPNGEVIGQDISANSLNDVAVAFKEALKPMVYPTIEEIVWEGKHVIKASFSGLEGPYSSYGRYYKRVFDRTEEMSPEELRRAMAESDKESFWENNLTSYGMERVDEKRVHSFYQRATSCGRLEEMSAYDPESLLTGLGLLKDGKLTNAGHYLFGNDGPILLKKAVYVTDERISFADISRSKGNIYDCIEDAMLYIKEHMDWRVEGLEGTSRIEVPEVPVDAIREIAVNAFAHADYRSDYEHEIDITPTRIEIYNPGSFPSDFKPEDFAEKQNRSLPRNKTILDVLYKSKDVEVFGSGFRKTYHACKEAGTKTDYEISPDGFTFVFFRLQRENVPVNVSANVPENRLSPSARKVLTLLKENPVVNSSTLALELNRTRKTVTRALKELKDAGFIKRIGSDKTGYWEVLKR